MNQALWGVIISSKDIPQLFQKFQIYFSAYHSTPTNNYVRSACKPIRDMIPIRIPLNDAS